MAFNRTTARRLCTDSEFDLFLSSQSHRIKKLDRDEVLQRLRRSRAARDKARDLGRRQTINRREKGKNTRGNERTWQKEELFSQIVERFEKRLEEMDAD